MNNNDTYKELLLLAISISESPEADAEELQELSDDIGKLLAELPDEDVDFFAEALFGMLNKISR